MHALDRAHACAVWWLPPSVAHYPAPADARSRAVAVLGLASCPLSAPARRGGKIGGPFTRPTCALVASLYKRSRARQGRVQFQSDIRRQSRQSRENPRPFHSRRRGEEKRGGCGLSDHRSEEMKASGGARMTAAKMAAPWVLSCSFLLCLATFQGAEGAIGVNYGMVANNLPAPEQVISMYKARNISYVRLFHPDQSVLNALRGSGIGVVLGTLNEDLPRLASDPSFAASWVATNVQPFAGAVQFRYINAGNEVIPGDPAAQVLPAMQNLESALRSAGVAGVPVTTAVATSVLGASYPPSQGAFSEAAAPVMAPIVSYLSSKGAPLLVNVYPYFAYSGSGGKVALGYALLSPEAATASSVADGGVVYTNMFDAIVDATHAAVEKAGVQGLELVVSETGWPSGGGEGATVENAAAYNNNVVRHVGAGTPRRPGKAVETYLFAMFNENGKAEGVEQHFGLFQPDMTEVYHVDFTAGST